MSSRLDEIERRLVTLESAVDAAPSVRFHGPWRDGVSYPAGCVVQRGGSLYVATVAAQAGIVPGLSPHDDESTDDDTRGPWRLACRRGRPGKDGRNPPDVERRLRALEQSR